MDRSPAPSLRASTMFQSHRITNNTCSLTTLFPPPTAPSLRSCWRTDPCCRSLDYKGHCVSISQTDSKQGWLLPLSAPPLARVAQHLAERPMGRGTESQIRSLPSPPPPLANSASQGAKKGGGPARQPLFQHIWFRWQGQVGRVRGCVPCSDSSGFFSPWFGSVPNFNL